MEDSGIVQLYWDRAEEAIAETAEKYGKYCFSISYGILRDREDADECVSETWYRAWNTMPPQRPVALQPFLAKITRNLSLDRYRRKHALFRGGGQVPRVLEELEHAAPSARSPEETVEELVLVSSLEQFIRTLSGEKRQVFLLRYWYFYSEREIAQMMYLSKSKVSSMLFRLRKSLREHLEKEGIGL